MTSQHESSASQARNEASASSELRSALAVSESLRELVASLRRQDPDFEQKAARIEQGLTRIQEGARQALEDLQGVPVDTDTPPQELEAVEQLFIAGPGGERGDGRMLDLFHPDTLSELNKAIRCFYPESPWSWGGAPKAILAILIDEHLLGNGTTSVQQIRSRTGYAESSIRNGLSELRKWRLLFTRMWSLETVECDLVRLLRDEKKS